MLAIANLRKTYGSFVALDGLNLTIKKGEILALLGPNGAGKSTTVKCLVGLHKPDAGSVHIDGHDALSDSSTRRLIGYLPEVALFCRIRVLKRTGVAGLAKKAHISLKM